MKKMKKSILVLPMILIALTGCEFSDPSTPVSSNSVITDSTTVNSISNSNSAIVAGDIIRMKSGSVVLVDAGATIIEGNDLIKIVKGTGTNKDKLYALRGGEAKIRSKLGADTTVEITYELADFANGDIVSTFNSVKAGYSDPASASKKMLVGTKNDYILDLKISYYTFDEDLERDTEFGNLQDCDSELEYTVTVNGVAKIASDYFDVLDRGIIKLKELAVGKELELSVKEKALNKTAKHTFLVNDCYNAYDNDGFRTLFEDNDIHGINILRTIKAELMANQFYMNYNNPSAPVSVPFNTYGIESEIAGFKSSVYLRYFKRGTVGNVLTINGNFNMINARDIPFHRALVQEGHNYSDELKGSQPGYNVDGKTLNSQRAIFRIGTEAYDEQSAENSVTFNDLSIEGNTNRPILNPNNPNEAANDGGMQGIRCDATTLRLNNTNIRYTYHVFAGNFVGGKVYADYGKFSDTWASTMLMWDGSLIDVKHSAISRAGSAVIYVNDSKPDHTPVINFDASTTLDNLVSGNSVWFNLNNMSGIGQAAAAMDNLFAPNGLTLFKSEEGSLDNSTFNLLFLVLSDDGTVSPYARISLGARTSVDPHEYYDPSSATPEEIMAWETVKTVYNAIRASQNANFDTHGSDIIATMFAMLNTSAGPAYGNATYAQLLQSAQAEQAAGLLYVDALSKNIADIKATGAPHVYLAASTSIGTYSFTAYLELFNKA